MTVTIVPKIFDGSTAQRQGPELETGGIEYKCPEQTSKTRKGEAVTLGHFTQAEMTQHIDDETCAEWWQKFSSAPTKENVVIEIVFAIKSKYPIIYCSDTAILNRTWDAKRYQDGTYLLRSSAYECLVDIVSGDATWRGKRIPTDKLMYVFSIGDDHILISKFLSLQRQYEKAAEENWHQNYNQKADYINNTSALPCGIVIAEVLASVDRRNRKFIPCLYSKLKQLIVEKWESGAKDSWMDRSTAIRTQITREYSTIANVDRQRMYLLIEKAELLLFEINERSIRRFYSEGLDPRLSRKLGGYEITSQAKLGPVNILTKLHLSNIWELYQRYPDILPKYIKTVRKLSSRYRTETQKRDFKLYSPGSYQVSRKDFKDMIYRLFGFITVMDKQPTSVRVSAQRVCEDVSQVVCLYASELNPHSYTALRKIDFSPSTGAKHVPPSKFTTSLLHEDELSKLLPYIDQILKIVDHDNRKLSIDAETMKVYLLLKARADELQEKLSAARHRATTSVSAADFSTENPINPFEIDRSIITGREFLTELAQVRIAMRLGHVRLNEFPNN
jgi:hypothetical protein